MIALDRSLTSHHARQRGFSLVEMSIVLAIVGLLLGGMLMTLGAQVEQKRFNETQAALEAARDAIYAYAIANGRLPCPATSNSAGQEVRLASGVCGATGSDFDYYGGIVSGVRGGLLPAVTLGLQPVDSSGFALDGWGNRIRYAVSKTTNPSNTAHFTNRTNLQTNGMSVTPYDLVVCASATGISPSGTPPSCGTATKVTELSTVAAIILSPGKNGALTPSTDEAANDNRAGANDAVFVYRTPTPATATAGEFDDQMIWITGGGLYLKLLSAGILP